MSVIKPCAHHDQPVLNAVHVHAVHPSTWGEVKSVPFYVLCLQERLLALKRSMTFMQEIDFSQQAALLGDEDVAQEETVAEVMIVPVEATTKKSKKQSKEVIR